MHFKKVIFAASGAYATSDVCSTSLIANSTTDLETISSCTTFTGDLTLSSGLTGDISIPDGLVTIDGSLTIFNATELAVLDATTLVNITGALNLQQLTILDALNFPALTSVGSILFETLPGLSTLNFAPITSAGSVYIADTALTSLTGINVNTTTQFTVVENNYLSNITVGLTQVSQAVDIAFNGPSLYVSFPSLQWANNITLFDASKVYLPQLSTVNNSLSFNENLFLGLTLPNLQTVGASLAIINNTQASNISFPVLTSIGGGFSIANNSNLNSISGFPKLATVDGAIDFVGNFSSASLPALTLVKGAVDVDSTNYNFNCSAWDSSESSVNVEGTSSCTAPPAPSTSAASATSASGTASGAAASATSTSTSTSKAAAVPVVIEYTSVFGALAAFIFQLL